MKHLKKFQNIYNEHRALYNTGAALMLSYIIKPLFAHISFLLFFLSFSGVCCIIYGLLLHFQKHSNKAVRIAAASARITALILIAAFILSMAVIQIIIVTGMKSTDAECDYIFVLGGGIKDGKPTKAVIYRINRALEYLEKYPDTKMILCGGKTKRHAISEAAAMKNYMTELGVDPQKIILEDKSLDTTQNINYAISIIKQNGDNINNCKIGVVTNGYHIYRSVLIMKKAGIKEPCSLAAKNPGYLVYNLNCHLREYFSVILEYLNL